MSTEVPPPPKEFEIEKLLFHHDFKVSGKQQLKRLYFVKWEGYMMYESSWEPALNIPKNIVKDYEASYGSFSKISFDKEINDYELEDDEDTPPKPRLVPIRIVHSRVRRSYKTEKNEKMYLVSYQYVEFNVWETTENEDLTELITEFEGKNTGKKRKRRTKHDSSGEEEEDAEEYVYEPPEKYQKVDEDTKKAKRAYKKRRKSTNKSKKKKKKKSTKDKDNGKGKKKKSKKKKKKKKTTRRGSFRSKKRRKKKREYEVEKFKFYRHKIRCVGTMYDDSDDEDGTEFQEGFKEMRKLLGDGEMCNLLHEAVIGLMDSKAVESDMVQIDLD